MNWRRAKAGASLLAMARLNPLQAGFYRIIFAGIILTAASAAFAADAPVEPASDRPSVIVVVGAGGEEMFATDFAAQANLWAKACEQAGCRRVTIGVGDGAGGDDYERFKQALAAEPKTGVGEFWLVLIGHGTFDGKEAKFNLRGPDLPATDLALWLQPFRRPLAVIDTASASAPFLAKLSGRDRIVVTATRSGNETNYARFGRYFAAALADPQSDLDKDGQTSLLEAFLSASHQVAEFYKTEGRLATEHALLDDNGDGLGTPADWFRGVRAIKKPQDGKSLDGARAQQFCLIRSAAEEKLTPEVRARRDELELKLVGLREARGAKAEAGYFRELEALLLEIARLYEPPAT